MFASISQELFPNTCQVLEINPGIRYVYPIFKNGSSSLIESGYSEVSKEQLLQVKNVEVYVRDPHARFVSGVKTFLSKLPHGTDQSTALHFVKTYMFLNRHFCPQIYWLINFRRFSNATFTLRPLSDLREITNKSVNHVPSDDISDYFSNNTKVKFYNEVDEVLTVNLIGQTVTLEDIFDTLREYYADLYQEMFELTKSISNVVP